MAAQSNDKDLSELLKKVHNGTWQLPEFQRSWVWDDTRILDCIQKAMGKMVAGRNSADILREFGQAI